MNCSRKAAHLLAMCTSPCPPSSLGRNSTDCGSQWSLSQKKSTITAWTRESRLAGGSTTASLCHNEENTRLLITRVLPLKDIQGNSHLHLFSLPSMDSKTPSQFFFSHCSSPKYTPGYFNPPSFQLNLPGKTSPFRESFVVAKASLLFQLTLDEDSLLKSSTFPSITFMSTCVFKTTMISSA